jgi:AraC-like DNA-binding protein
MLPCEVTWDTQAACAVIPDAALARRGAGFDPALWDGILAASDALRKARSASQSPDVEAIEEMVWQALAQHRRAPQFAEIARSLDRSERTLARSLAQSGLTYREIVDRVRMSMAQDFLLRAGLAVGAVSERLGYSDVSAFVRAFRRCFGVPPDQWRRHAGQRLRGAGRVGTRA